jgi:hypothetical protein
MKLKYFDVDEVPGKSAKIGAWVGGGFAVVVCLIGLFEKACFGSIIGMLILGTPLFALGGWLVGWIIGWIIKLVVKCLPKKEKPRFDRFDTTEHFSRRPPSNEVIDPLVGRFMDDGGLK